MRGFVYISWPDPPPPDVRARFADGAVRAGWRHLETRSCSWCGVAGPAPLQAKPVPANGLLLGEVRRTPPSLGAGEDATPLHIARTLCRDTWGRYVVLFRDAEGRIQSVFRDPSGALEVFVWRSGTATVLSSDTPDSLMAAAPPDALLDWSEIGRQFAEPARGLDTLALTGLEALAPGEWRDLDSGLRHRLWRPETFARLPARTAADNAAALREALDETIQTFTDGRNGLGAEVSGGLDSAIVVGSVIAAGRRLGLALNTVSDRPETDEQIYARAVAERAGVELTRYRRPDGPLTAALLEATAGAPRPSQNGRDVFNDLAVAEACRDAGVTTLLTGKGGDALFFQGHTPLAFADLFHARGWAAAASPLLPGVARWTRTSAWSILAQARQQRAGGAGDSVDEPEPPPAKRLQIAQIRSGLAYYGACRRTDGVDLVHPLMAQPLLEWGLRTPVPQLVAGGRDRALARDAFTDRLPRVIVDRRSKGDYSAYFNRQVAANLPFLRTYLLDGRLAAEGVLDRPTFAARLEVDELRWRGGAPEILAAASLEAWVRRWEARLQVPRSTAAPTSVRTTG